MSITTGILLVEASLEGALVEASSRRTLVNVFRAMQGSFLVPFELFHERIYDINGLRNILTRCAKQNNQRRSKGEKSGQFCPKTNIKYVHIGSHGTRQTLCLPMSIDDDRREATADDVADAFAELKAAKIRAVILSSCHTGASGELAEKIIRNSGVKAVIGYPQTAYDHICAIAEQLLYFQLLQRKRRRIWEAVRRVNDALVVLGEKEDRLLACWTREDGPFAGPCPWWDKSPDVKDKASRSFLSSIRELVPQAGPISQDGIRQLRHIVKNL